MDVPVKLSQPVRVKTRILALAGGILASVFDRDGGRYGGTKGNLVILFGGDAFPHGLCRSANERTDGKVVERNLDRQCSHRR